MKSLYLRRAGQSMLFLHVVVEGAVRLEAFITDLADLRLLLNMMSAGRPLGGSGASTHLVDVRCQVSGVGCRVSGVGCRVSGVR